MITVQHDLYFTSIAWASVGETDIIKLVLKQALFDFSTACFSSLPAFSFLTYWTRDFHHPLDRRNIVPYRIVLVMTEWKAMQRLGSLYPLQYEFFSVHDSPASILSFWDNSSVLSILNALDFLFTVSHAMPNWLLLTQGIWCTIPKTMFQLNVVSFMQFSPLLYSIQ